MFSLLKTTVLVISGALAIFLSAGCANQNEPAAKPKAASIEVVQQNSTVAPITDSNQRVWDRPASGTPPENTSRTSKLGASQAPLPMVGERPRSTGILLTSAKPAAVKAPVPVARPETVPESDHTKPTLVALPVPTPPAQKPPEEAATGRGETVSRNSPYSFSHESA